MIVSADREMLLRLLQLGSYTKVTLLLGRLLTTPLTLLPNGIPFAVYKE